MLRCPTQRGGGFRVAARDLGEIGADHPGSLLSEAPGARLADARGRPGADVHSPPLDALMEGEKSGSRLVLEVDGLLFCGNG